MFPSSIRDGIYGERGHLKTIYHKFQSLLGRRSDTSVDSNIEDGMHSNRSRCDEPFMTPVSSTGDLMKLSPKGNMDNSDFLTGTDFDNVSEVTMFDTHCYVDTNTNNIMATGKESLYIKFDPLYSKANNDVALNNNECDIGYETGSATSMATDNVLLPAKHSFSMDSLTCHVKEKPTQVVMPAVVKQNTLDQYPQPPQLVRSVSAILTPTRVAIDRLITINGDSPPLVSPNRYQYNTNTNQSDHIASLKNLLQKLDLQNIQLRDENYELKSQLKENSDQKQEYEMKVKKLTSEKEGLQEKIHNLTQLVEDKVVGNKKLATAMEEYQSIISSMIKEHQQNQSQFVKLLKTVETERDEALKHLSHNESAFNDLLSKYEKCKSTIMSDKTKEMTLLEELRNCKSDLDRYSKMYEQLQNASVQNSITINDTLENMNKSHGKEMAKLNATIKKYEIQISSLQDSLAHKTRDNEELTRICDQLINSQ